MNLFKNTQQFVASQRNPKKGLNKNLSLYRFSFLFFMFFYSSAPLISQTLCSQYGSGSFTYVVGSGSPGNILNSSQLGTSLPVGATVYVIGDFTVDDNFTLTNSIVKVNGGTKIAVLNSNFNWNGISFTLNNTKVFACNSLWKGITLGGLCNISMTSTTVEDAETAISAIDVNFATLYLDNNVFNRNKVGINLDATNTSGGWWAVPPTLNYFVNNTFSCTSPLNTIGGKTEYGLRIKDVSYPLAYNYGNSGNEFKGLKFGISIQGIYCNYTMYRYGFENIESKAVAFLNGDYLNIQLSSFKNIKLWGVHFENSRQLITENTSFIAEPDNSITDRRYMLDVERPKEGNTIIINNNDWFNYANFTNCISVRPGFQPIFLNAEIESNSLYLFNASGTTARCMYIGGNYTTESNVKIINNSLNFDGNNVPNSNVGIEISDGNKHNVKIISNKFESGQATFCRLEGSSGFNNEFSDNRFFQGQNNKYGLGLALDNFQNAKICSNIDNFATFTTYAIVNSNFNTDFTNNITYGRVTPNANFTIGGQFVNPLSFIGTQIHKGNQWLSYQGTNPFILSFSTSAANVLLSQFIVHTNQPSIYFPSNIQTPNALFSPFFQTLSGTPNDACVAQLVEDPIIDAAIAQAKMSDYTMNTALLFDADLHLMRKMQKYPSYFNENQIYKNFIQKNQGKNNSKFKSIEDDIDESYKMKDISKNKISNLRDEISVLEEGNKKFNKTNRPSNDEIKAFYKHRLELDNKINAIYKEHGSEKKLKHKETKKILESVLPIALHEKLNKEVYQIYLDAQINNDGIFTSEQNARMKAIASTCVNDGGMIVYVARGLLTGKDLEEVHKEIEICEPKITVEPYYSTNTSSQIQANKKIVHQVNIFPNPANESVTINLKDITGVAQVIDLTGKLLKSVNLTSGDNTIRHELAKGIYMINIKLSDGYSITQKLSINY